MMRRPPVAVPAARVRAQVIFTQRGTVNSGVRRNWSQPGRWDSSSMRVAEKRASAMMPMVFWASLQPWLKPRNAALRIWSLLNTRLVTEGRLRASRA